MNNIKRVIKDIAYKYYLENQDAQVVAIKITFGSGWYGNKINETFKIWNKPDRFHTELFGEKAYYIAEGDWEWVGLVRESNIEFI